MKDILKNAFILLIGIQVFISCSEPDPDLPPPLPDTYCVYVEAEICFQGDYAECPGGGLLTDNCPFGNSVNGNSSSSAGYSLNDDIIELDVIIRDFPVGYEGFEEFDTELGNNGKCAENNFSCWDSNLDNCYNFRGSNFGGRISNWNRDNAICFTGDEYHSCSENRPGQATLRYGQNDYQLTASTGAIRGFCNGPDKEPLFGDSNCNGLSGIDSIRANWIWGGNKRGWSNPVGVTKGMVEEWLNYDACRNEDLVGKAGDPEFIRGRYCARPMPANGQCYGGKLHEWFTDGGSAKTIQDIMIFKKVGNRNLFEIKYDYNTRRNWNGYGDDVGYFPLDEYSDNYTYGKQSLSVWCPNNLGSDDASKLECDRWRSNGGPKDGDAAGRTAEAGGVDKKKLHNYGFTVAGSGEFKYEQGAGDVFKFIGGDDMWIFLDGKLAVDLGGIHSAAPGVVKIDEWAQNNGWENGTMHVINFFYAERQTEDSNIMFQVVLGR